MIEKKFINIYVTCTCFYTGALRKYTIHITLAESYKYLRIWLDSRLNHSRFIFNIWLRNSKSNSASRIELKLVCLPPTVKLLCCQPSCLSLTVEIFCTVMLPYQHYSSLTLCHSIRVHYTLSQMTNFILIIVLCVTQLDGLP